MSAMDTSFVPAEIEATQWAAIEPLLTSLLTREVSSSSVFERWLVDRGELEAACAEAQTNLYIDMTCDTENAGKQRAYTTYLETIPPKLRPRLFELDRLQVELSSRYPLDHRRYEVLDRSTRADVELFRPENVAIMTELEKSAQAYQQVIGGMSVSFEGREQTLPQMAKYQESPDRDVRERAWRAVAERRLMDAEKIEAIYDEQIGQRDSLARNAGFAGESVGGGGSGGGGFVAYMFKALKRFDYTPADCARFHEAIAKRVVPVVRRWQAKRARDLGVEVLRPWDLAVDPKGREALRPFEGGADLVRKSLSAMRKLDGRLEGMLKTMGDGSNTKGAAGGACLDLDSRKGKAPGGYQSQRERSRTPFIFMNAAGLQRDVETMMHEAGHAFHSMVCVDEPILAYRSAPIEFCEVASMSMELLSMRHWGGRDGFYPSEADHVRAMRKQLESPVVVLPWIAQIDAFQHWVYAHPGHTYEERQREWLRLDERFGLAGESWAGLEKIRRKVWHRQSHLFTVPLYYVEYGLAQLGALQLWVKSLEEGEPKAVEAYLRGLKLGGSRPLPELFEACGVRFAFDEATIGRLMDRVEAEMAKLPE
jgi:oligoendopeptidase F